jgi:hypothetical protein
MSIHPLRAAERHLRTYPLDRGIIRRARLAIVADIYNEGWRAGWQARDSMCPVDVPPPPAQVPQQGQATDTTPDTYAI